MMGVNQQTLMHQSVNAAYKSCVATGGNTSSLAKDLLLLLAPPELF